MIPITSTLSKGKFYRCWVKFGTEISLLFFSEHSYGIKLRCISTARAHGICFLYPGLWEDCEIDQMWEKERVEESLGVPQLHYLFTCLLCELWCFYLEIIFHLFYNVFGIKLWSVPQITIIIALTNNGAVTINTLLQGYQMRKQKLTHSF